MRAIQQLLMDAIRGSLGDQIYVASVIYDMQTQFQCEKSWKCKHESQSRIENPYKTEGFFSNCGV